jgi:hypothetical protein
MPRLRCFMLWLLMLALPLQGWAAASMLCAMPAARAALESTVQMDHAAHDHASHTGHASHQSHQHDDDAVAHTASDSVHKCSNCGACHAAALPSAPLPADPHPLPQARLAEPLQAHASLAPRALFRPPRA